jgi:hypothetical protein
MFQRLRLSGRRRRGFPWRGFRLNVDDHFSRLGRGSGEVRQRHEHGGVERDDDRDGDRAKPWRAQGRRLEGAPVQRRGGHGGGAFGGAEAGETVRRGPDTMAIRAIPFAASSSITATTSP